MNRVAGNNPLNTFVVCRWIFVFESSQLIIQLRRANERYFLSFLKSFNHQWSQNLSLLCGIPCPHSLCWYSQHKQQHNHNHQQQQLWYSVWWWQWAGWRWWLWWWWWLWRWIKQSNKLPQVLLLIIQEAVLYIQIIFN